MKISNKSLHYRFNRLVQGEAFKHKADCGRFTTCSYIRTCIFSLLKGSWNAFIALIVGTLICWFVGSALIVPFAIMFGYVPNDAFAVPCVAVWGGITLALVSMTFGAVKERIRDNSRKYKRYTKEPNVFVQAIVDKHNKFCTRVEVV